MLKFNQFLKENRDEEHLPIGPDDWDFENQVFTGMDAYDIRDKHLHGETSDEQLGHLIESLVPDAKFKSAKYANIRNSKQAKLEAVYGHSHKPLTNDEISKNAVETAKWFDSLKPEDQKKELGLARKRRAAAGLGGHLSGNQKNETANDVPTNGRKNRTVGVSGSPAQYSHITSDGSHKVVNTCVNATASCGGVGEGRGIHGSCLAQKAQGQQDTSRANRDHYSQGEHHSIQSSRDHVITLMHEIRSANDKANRGELK